MTNQVVIIGRLVRTPEITKLDNGKTVSNITVAVSRTIKNNNGEYETDFIDCELWNGVANSTAEYCEKGDLIGIKGYIKVEFYNNEGVSQKSTKVVAEKITFLQSKKK